MSKLTLAASLISAGLATLITAAVVEKRMLKDHVEIVDREVEASVMYLVYKGKAEATEEFQQEHQQLFGTRFNLDKPAPDEVAANTNQRIRYDAVIKGEGYSPESEDDTDGAEAELEVCDTLGEIYAISTDEYLSNESGFFQSMLTYFADGAVIDEDHDLVVDFVDLIGNAVPPFGTLSGESHIVYLRNTKVRREFEVVFDEANYVDVMAEPGDRT